MTESTIAIALQGAYADELGKKYRWTLLMKDEQSGEENYAMMKLSAAEFEKNIGIMFSSLWQSANSHIFPRYLAEQKIELLNQLAANMAASANFKENEA